MYESKRCKCCNRAFIPTDIRQVTCGDEDCVSVNSMMAARRSACRKNNVFFDERAFFEKWRKERDEWILSHIELDILKDFFDDEGCIMGRDSYSWSHAQMNPLG